MNKSSKRVRINREIRSSQVRLVGNNVKVGIYPIEEALKITEQLEVDLVEISQGDLPICKAIMLDKYLYEQKIKDKEQKKKQKQMEIKVKEIRLGSNIDEHDFDFKLKHAINFLKDGDSVLVNLFFKGREISHSNLGFDILKRFVEELKDYGVAENKIKMEGKKIFVKIRSKSKK